MSTFGVDKNGIIITEVSFDKITLQFRPIVENVLNSIIQEFASQLDGVYLYGSIPKGKAVEGKSDLDAILVFKDQPTEESLEKTSSLEKRLSEAYDPMLRGIGLGVTCIDDVCSDKEKYGGMCFMKHLCICIYGNDVAKNVAGFKPSKEVAKGFNGDIQQSLEISRSKIKMTSSDHEISKISQSVAKKILRTGFSLVMPRSGSWTTDLQTACDTFVKYYPDKASEMNLALDWSRSDSSDKRTVIEFIDTFGKWLSEEFQKAILSNL
jgi:predicted nucleotidyltransferase